MINTVLINASLKWWTDALAEYTLPMLCVQPASGGWSAGQLFLHLINDTKFYLQQAATCRAHATDADKGPTPEGRAMLEANSFPDIRITGAADHAYIPQPASKQMLLDHFLVLKAAVTGVSTGLSPGTKTGKTAHPGLGYFDALEWLQFADMHLRHHQQQLCRIAASLKEMNTDTTR